MSVSFPSNSGTRCAIQRWGPAGVSFERGQGRFQGGGATPVLQTTRTAICGLQRNFLPRKSIVDTQILSLAGTMGLPHAGCGQLGPGIRYCGSPSPHMVGNLPGSRIYLHYMAFDWQAQYFSYLCRGQQCLWEGDSASRRRDAYFDQLHAMAKRSVTIKGRWVLFSVIGI